MGKRECLALEFLNQQLSLPHSYGVRYRQKATKATEMILLADFQIDMDNWSLFQLLLIVDSKAFK
jgi:hypothetical protein